jgi:DNA-binding transcriptional regulator YiaG
VQPNKNKQRIVREAVTLMGQLELAARLGMSMEDVSSWLEGTAAVPDRILLQLSEILLSWSGKRQLK